jgi:hypothetical protein
VGRSESIDSRTGAAPNNRLSAAQACCQVVHEWQRSQWQLTDRCQSSTQLMARLRYPKVVPMLAGRNQHAMSRLVPSTGQDKMPAAGQCLDLNPAATVELERLGCRTGRCCCQPDSCGLKEIQTATYNRCKNISKITIKFTCPPLLHLASFSPK